MLKNIGNFTRKKEVQVLVALVKDRLLGVNQHARKMGVGKPLVVECIRLVRQAEHAGVILHTTDAMKIV